jgi:hypothetical protein
MQSEVPLIQQQGFENSQMQQNLVQKLNLLNKIPFLNGILLQNISLATGVNSVPHKLQRKYQGWFFTKKSSAATVYQTSSSDDVQFLTLTASASVDVDIWVF